MKRPGRLTRAQKIAANRRETRARVWVAFESPDSQNIAGAKYCAQTQEMVITFAKAKPGYPGRVYAYAHVPAELWARFEAEALSKGKFFSNCIRPYYVGVPCE